jgi:hypothetical protein
MRYIPLLCVASVIPLSSLFVGTAAGADSYAAEACGLISSRVASSVLGQVVAVAPAEFVHAPGRCEWTTGGKSVLETPPPNALLLSIDIEPKDSLWATDDEERLDNPNEVKGTAVAQVGDRAIWVAHPVNFGPYLVMQKGNSVVNIEVTAFDSAQKNEVTLEQLKALAREVISHLPREANPDSSLPVNVPMQKGWITDNAGILSLVQQQRLSGVLTNYYAETHHQMALLIAPTLGGESIETYSLRVANAWQLGCRGLDDGILVTLAVQEREVRIEIGRGMERFISGAQAQAIINEAMIPAFAKGDFSAGFEGGFKRLMVEARQLANPTSCHATDVSNHGI